MSAAGLYGKIRAQADFARIGAGEFQRLGLDHWFQEANEAVYIDKSKLPDEPVAFAVCPPQSPQAVLGVLHPSQDAVGRSFPAIVFALAPADLIVGHLAELPASHAGFFAAAAELAAAAPTLPTAELTARLAALPTAGQPSPRIDEWLASESTTPLGFALGGLPHGLAYAARTLATGCDQALTGAATGKGGAVTVDVPAPTDVSAGLWLAIAQARLRGRVAPSFFWLPRSGRLLLTLGPPSAPALAFVANPRHKSNKLWPLRSEAAAALDAAVASLTPEQRLPLETPGATLADVWLAFRA